MRLGRGLRRLLVLLLWAAAALGLATDCTNRIPRVGVEGEDLVLSPSVAANGSLTKVSWKKGEDIVAGPKLSLGKGNPRLRLDSSGNWLLKNFSKDDAGQYTAEVVIDDEIKTTCFDLKTLVQPEINCTVSNDTIQLSCTSASEDLPVAYSWDNLRREDVIEVNDAVLQLQRNSGRFQEITCYVRASSANASTSIQLRDCVPEEEPDRQSSNTLVIALLTTIIIIILIGSLLLYFIWRYLKKRKSESHNVSANNARGNDEQGGSELPEGEPLTSIELKSMEKREEQEETPRLDS